MKALSAIIRAVALAAGLLVPVEVTGQSGGADALAKARQHYNAEEYEQAIAVARSARLRPAIASEASLLLGRALLERHRATRAAEDLSGARDALRAVDASLLNDRGRLDLMVGLGESLYLDGDYRPAAALLDAALDQVSLLPAVAREQLADWWSTAMDRFAQTRPPGQRAEVYLDITVRMRTHLGRYPDSSAAPYWLSAAALARGDLELAWDLALAGWVRSTLTPDKGTLLRADLDRLVTQAVIPERVRRMSGDPDVPEATARFTAEWHEAKGRWGLR